MDEMEKFRQRSRKLDRHYDTVGGLRRIEWAIHLAYGGSQDFAVIPRAVRELEWSRRRIQELESEVADLRAQLC